MIFVFECQDLINVLIDGVGISEGLYLLLGILLAEHVVISVDEYRLEGVPLVEI